jgi:hypothetical protein
MGIVLIGSGLIAAAIGVWRGYSAARLALAPLVHDGEPTRTAVEAGRPVLARPRVRLFARRVAESLVWTLLAFYGLFMISVGAAAP